ncbi:DUF481 domain-containing protein [Winogradskyella aurantia]|uniref:DUF481 domain-containing protein n=1 Tax=Winogradskyella aurantia TaxID=1915063 RepID=A0A265UXB6_9FLAO|nr:DUF481 domain-containing protein [Winogradskyella aurantia]OZV69949.1 hypothetical protein CA834_04845 [Winogradskyella aurantia]
MRIIFVFAFLLVSALAFSQNDTIVVKNGNVLYGEIKKLRSGVLTMETPYSDSDFSIDFSEVTQIKIQKRCFLILSGGRRRTGYVKSKSANTFTFSDNNGTTEVFDISELIVLDEISDRFWKRISGNIDLSYTLTKANNASQLTVGGGLAYRGPKWVFDASINSLDSNQDNTAEIQRTNITSEIQRILPRNWYLLANVSFLSNTEQALDSRYGIRPGAGRFLVLSNKLSWGLNAGLNFNIENFSDATPDNQSTELFIGSQLNMFDYKDWSLNTNINVFPSLSESGRWRIDYSLDMKWDLPYDFYVKTSLQFNYDNQAAATGSDFDYNLTSGFGWSFN